MISIRHALTAPHRSLAALLLIPALTLAACGGEDVADDDAASADDDTASVSQDEAPDSDEAAAPEDDAADDAADDSAGEDDSDDPGEGGSFCDQFAEFLDAWAADELTPADLTAEYEALGIIAPDELVEPLEILAEGNEAALAGRSIPEEYDAAGQTMADYARDQCGISAPW